MTTTVIILLLIIGLLLLLAEILIIPGFGLTGIGGIVLVGAGLYFAYSGFGTFYGTVVLVASICLFVLLFVLLSRLGLSEKMKLKSQVDSHVNEQDNSGINVGDHGVAATRLNLYGRVKVNGTVYQAKALTFVDVGTPVEVVKIESSIVIVKPL